MAVKLTLTTDLSISSTTADEKDLGNIHKFFTSNAMGEGGSRKILVPGGTTDASIGLCDIATARFLMIITNPKNENDPSQEISIKRNSVGAEAILIKPFDDIKIGFFALTTDSLTDLFVTNPGSVDVELTIAVAGD